MEAYYKKAMDEKSKYTSFSDNAEIENNLVKTTMNNSNVVLAVYKPKFDDRNLICPSLTINAFVPNGGRPDQSAKEYLIDLKIAKEKDAASISFPEDIYWRKVAGEKFDAITWIDYSFKQPIIYEAFARKKEGALLLIFIAHKMAYEREELHVVLNEAKVLKD